MAQLQRDKSENQMICELFDSFVKSALRNKSKTLARDYLRTAKYEQPVWDIECYDHEGRSEEYRVEAGYEIKIYRFGGSEFSPAEQAEIVIKRFFQDLFEKHGLSIF